MWLKIGYFCFFSEKILFFWGPQKLICRLEKVLLVLKCPKIGRFWDLSSFGRTAANFKYFLTREKPGKSWDVLFANSEKEKKFQALAKSLLEKIILNFAQKWQKFKNTFLALKWSKMICFAWKWCHSKVQTILNSFSPGNFFHTAFTFCCRSAWNMLCSFWCFLRSKYQNL